MLLERPFGCATGNRKLSAKPDGFALTESGGRGRFAVSMRGSRNRLKRSDVSSIGPFSLFRERRAPRLSQSSRRLGETQRVPFRH